MTINTILFTQLERDLQKSNKTLYNYLAPTPGKVYIITITRQNCPACQKQKPKLQKLAATLTQQHPDKIVFTNIHVNYTKYSSKESNRSKILLGHHFYPTTKILTKTPDHEPMELCKNIEPPITKLKNTIKTALKIATQIQTT